MDAGLYVGDPGKGIEDGRQTLVSDGGCFSPWDCDGQES